MSTRPAIAALLAATSLGAVGCSALERPVPTYTVLAKGRAADRPWAVIGRAERHRPSCIQVRSEGAKLAEDCSRTWAHPNLPQAYHVRAERIPGTKRWVAHALVPANVATVQVELEFRRSRSLRLTATVPKGFRDAYVARLLAPRESPREPLDDSRFTFRACLFDRQGNVVRQPKVSRRSIPLDLRCPIT
jgi:hypothetical protein